MQSNSTEKTPLDEMSLMLRHIINIEEHANSHEPDIELIRDNCKEAFDVLKTGDVPELTPATKAAVFYLQGVAEMVDWKESDGPTMDYLDGAHRALTGLPVFAQKSPTSQKK